MEKVGIERRIRVELMDFGSGSMSGSDISDGLTALLEAYNSTW